MDIKKLLKKQTDLLVKLFLKAWNSVKSCRHIFTKPRTGRLHSFGKKSHLLHFNSVRFEISVIYTLILGLILITFSSIFYIITSKTLYDELDNELHIKAVGIRDNIQTYLEVKGEEPQTLQYAVEQTIAREDKTLRRWWFIGFERSWFKKLDEQDLSEDFVNFISLDKKQSIKSKNFQDDLLSFFTLDINLEQGKEKFWNLDIGDKEIRVINYPYPAKGPPTHIIQIGISKGPVIHLLNQWMTSILISIPVILILTGFIGTLLAGRVLKPIDRIIDTASNISYENLNLRVEPKLHYQEMDNLIKTFNRMLSRLEESFGHINEFSTHVAHELKTPLTIIRGEAELSYFSAKSKEDRKSLKVIIDEIDKVLRTIEDLLFLGKTRYQPDSFNFDDVDLNRFLEEIVEQFKGIAAEKNITLQLSELSGDITIKADQLHLRRLFFNLLENSVKFTPRGGDINLILLIQQEKVQIRISDTGVGIAEKNISKVFDQFFHGETQDKGVGLGLSIAQAIAKAHNGEITLESRLSFGTTFIVTLPVSRASIPAAA